MLFLKKKVCDSERDRERERERQIEIEREHVCVCACLCTCATHSEPAAMSRYEASALSTPTGMTMLMTFSGQFFYCWVWSMGVQNTEAYQPQHSLQTSKCIHKACGGERKDTVVSVIVWFTIGAVVLRHAG